jgi:hypothetical protein
MTICNAQWYTVSEEVVMACFSVLSGIPQNRLRKTERNFSIWVASAFFRIRTRYHLNKNQIHYDKADLIDTKSSYALKR